MDPMTGQQFAAIRKAVREHNPGPLYGAGDVAVQAMTHTSGWGPEGATQESRLITPVPWPQAHPHMIVNRLDPAVRGRWPSAPMEEVDPRTLHASQPSLTSTGLEHYTRRGDSDELFNKTSDSSNLHPIVYQVQRPDTPDMNVLLSGHHRAATALVEGRPLQALTVRGGLIDLPKRVSSRQRR